MTDPSQDPPIPRRKARFLRLAADPSAYCWAGLALALVCWLWRIRAEHLEAFWINSDSLYPVNLVVDLFSDRYPLGGWRFSPASFWFPEVFLAGVGLLLTHSVVLATLLAGALQFCLLVLAIQLCWRILGARNLRLIETATLSSAVAIVLLVATHSGALHIRYCAFFMLSLHVGNLLMLMYAFDFGLLFAAERRCGAAYALVCAVGGMSNLLFLAHFTAPISGALVIAAGLGAIAWKRAWSTLALGWISSLAGAISAKTLLHMAPASGQAALGLRPLKQAAAVFYHGAAGYLAKADFSHLVAYGWIIGCLAMCLRLLRRRSLNQVHESRHFIFLLFAAAASLASAAAVVLSGISSLTVLRDYYWTMHYLHPMFFLPLLAWPIFLDWNRWPATRIGILVLAFACFVAPLSLLLRAPFPDTDLRAYRPPLVRYLDTLSSQLGLRYGYAGYWQARIITLLSSRGLRVYQVDSNLRRFEWENNTAWYDESLEDRSKPPTLDFVVLHDRSGNIPKSAAAAFLGEPQRELSFEGNPILVYQNAIRPVWWATNEPLRAYAQEITSSVTRLELRSGQTLQLPVRIRNISVESWSSAGRAPVTLSYKWFENAQLLPIEGERTLLPKPLQPGESVDLEMKLVAPPEGRDLLLRVTLVQEGVAWFMTRGARTLDLPVTVTPSSP